MSEKSRVRILAGLIIVMLVSAFALILSPNEQSNAQSSPITVIDNGFTYDNKYGYTFKADISSTAGEIVKATLVFRALISQPYTMYPTAVLTPGTKVTVEVTQDYNEVFAPFRYEWQIFDSVGNSYSTPAVFARSGGTDLFAWKEYASPEGIIVRYYDDTVNAAGIAESAYAIEQKMIAGLKFTPEDPLYFVVFADNKDWCKALAGVGNAACDPSWRANGIYAPLQRNIYYWPTLTNADQSALWFGRSIGYSYWRTWLGDLKRNQKDVDANTWFLSGIASYFNDNMKEIAARRLQVMIAAKQLYPFAGNKVTATASANGNSEVMVNFDAQDYTAFSYFVDQYGIEKVTAVMNLYTRERKPFAIAFTEVIGLTVEQFETQWRATLGFAPAIIDPTQTPPSLPTLPPTPKMRSFPRKATPTATAKP